jgi:hypothetical protein
MAYIFKFYLIELKTLYGYSLATGKELPTAWQISPATKETQERLNLKAA